MNRRELLGTAAAVGAAVAAVGGTAAAQQPFNHDPIVECERVCRECIKAVDACFHECMDKMFYGKSEYKMLGIYCRETDEFCHIMARACGRRSPSLGHFADSCIKICRGCMDLCAPFPKDPIIQNCHKACGACIKACEAAAKSIQ